MAAVRPMTPQEQREAGHDPHREQYMVDTIVVRIKAVERAYTLRRMLDAALTIDAKEYTLAEWAQDSGRSRQALEDEAIWTERIPKADLYGAFEAEGINVREWAERIDPGHLMVIAKAVDQRTHRVLSPREMTQLAVECFHANWTVAELRQALRDRGLLSPEKQGLAGIPTKGVTACQALHQLADHLERNGMDFPMSALYLDPTRSRRPISAFEALGAIRDRLYKLYPRAIVPREMAEQWGRAGAQGKPNG